VEKGKWRNLLLIKQVRRNGEGGLRREEGYHDGGSGHSISGGHPGEDSDADPQGD